MTARKVRRARRIISKPGYNLERLMQMGELYGEWFARDMLAFDRWDKDKTSEALKKEWKNADVMRNRFYDRMLWYRYRIYETQTR